MTDFLKRFISANPILSKLMFLYFKTKGQNKAVRESQHRAKLSLFDIETLAQPIPYAPQEMVIDNNLYGYAYHLKKYAGISHDLQAYMEHGLFWGGMVHKDQQHWHTHKIITFGRTRVAAIAENLAHKTAIAIGPYVHYAPLLFDADTLNSQKKELGKVLLVFPSHSLNNVAANFDLQDFVAEINRIRTNYDTVLVSLYYLDALNKELVDFYKNLGYLPVTSGHKYDVNFVARQKTIIHLADATLSNEVGTHIGFCVSMDKPHYVYQQKLNFIATNQHQQQRFDTIYEADTYAKSQLEKNEVAQAFSSSSLDEITPTQRKIVEKYWGTDLVKTKAELLQLLN